MRATKSAFAVDLDEHTDFAAGVDVGADSAFVGAAGGLLGGRGHAALAQDDEGRVHIAVGFLEALKTVAHGGSGFFAKLLDEFCVDFLTHCCHLDGSSRVVTVSES